jgi:hypothetical protein
MFNNKYFYHGLIRKYVILVGTLFNDLQIEKTDLSGNVTSVVDIPITFAQKDKLLARFIADPNYDRPSSTMPLPLISFELTGINYDESRKLPTINKVVVKDDTLPNKMKYQYNLVPFNFQFKVYIYAKNAEDGTKILEQALPFFTPAWTTTLHLIPEVEETKDIPVVLDSINYEDNYDGNYTERRAIVWTLNLTLKGYLYGPIRRASVIKFINVNLYTPTVPDGKLRDAIKNTPIAEKITIQPGLTANGTPTTNINDTVDYNSINIDDEWAYLTRIIKGEEEE